MSKDAGVAASPAGTHEEVEVHPAEADELGDVPEWQIDRFAADLEEPPWVEPPWGDGAVSRKRGQGVPCARGRRGFAQRGGAGGGAGLCKDGCRR